MSHSWSELITAFTLSTHVNKGTCSLVHDEPGMTLTGNYYKIISIKWDFAWDPVELVH